MKYIILLFALSFVSASALAQSARWEAFQTDFAPDARSDPPMVYDSARRQTVLFSGWPHGTSDTWVWDGANWRIVSLAGPDPRYGHRMAFDESRQVVVMFGGIGPDGSELGDTWTWDGVEWSLAATTGPSPRHRHSMAYDAKREVVVLHGGIDDNGDSSQTWVWNGQHWTMVAEVDAPTQSPGALAYDPIREVCVYYAGRETWEWNGVEWTSRKVEGPDGQRFHHAMAYCAGTDSVILYGGFGPYPWGVFKDTWSYDGTSWTKLPIDGPPRRFTHSLAYDKKRDRIVTFGGRYGGRGSDLWGDTWEFVPEPIPLRNWSLHRR